MIHTGMHVNNKDGKELKVIQITSKDMVLLSDLNWYPKADLTEVGNECQLEAEPFFQCCCKCIHRVKVNLHCHDEPDREGCICGKTTGFACDVWARDEGLIQVNWPEHSCGCEMYTTQEMVDKWKKDSEAA